MKVKEEAMEQSWFYDESETSEEEFSIKEYDITATPNDFNIRTIYDFMEDGLLKIPGFQRNYVWDQKRASKLIESLIIGLPIPQIFLYEESRNSFLVIDGQQRLMSIYYFKKKRFPRLDKRPQLRKIFEEHGKIPDEIISNDEYFTNFNLQLPSPLPNQPNKFNKLNYDTLGEYQTTFDLRTIRNVVIRQNSPEDDEDSSIYEIFNRLNSGGINLTHQEIRISLYHSKFYTLLDKLNLRDRWRTLLGLKNPDLNAKDQEILLRAFAMLFYGVDYKPSMTRFLNSSSQKFRKIGDEAIQYCENLFDSFLNASQTLDDKALIGKLNNRFNISTFEAVFVATCDKCFRERALVTEKIDPEKIELLKNDPEFIEATQRNTASTDNVSKRRKIAAKILFGIE